VGSRAQGGSAARTELIRRIHDSPTLAVLAVTGGGAAALSDLLNVPGASRTILELLVPYAPGALADLLGAGPTQAVSAATAAAMAAACRQRAEHLAPDRSAVDPGTGRAGGAPPLVGVACTAALASDRAKRGEHRAHVACCDDSRTRQWTLALEKGARSRLEEDRVVSDVVLGVLALACGLPAAWPALGAGDGLSEDE
jgi:nicotinamide mononucleotide (NMN) deamidase PncC